VKPVRITLTVNGVKRELDVMPNESLLHVLRDRLHIISVKGNCFRGECGICTVLMNGRPVKSCQVLAPEADGSEIVTLEGLSKNGEPSLVQKAFLEEFGYQCGFCTSAFVLLGEWIINNIPNPTEEQIKEVLNAAVCRCTGYQQIIRAIKKAAQWKREGRS
jgi:carbon-monoxide dehydrogenase small subunit